MKTMMPAIEISDACSEDAQAILALQKLAYQSEAKIYSNWSLPPLTETIDAFREELFASLILKATWGDRIVGSVRGRAMANTCAIGRLVVHPELQGRGIGSQLLRAVETPFKHLPRFELFTGSKSVRNLRLYQRHGYSIIRTQVLSSHVAVTFLEKESDS